MKKITIQKKQQKVELEPKLKNKLNSLRKILQMDGGDIEVIEYDNKKNILFVELTGLCNHCPMAEITIKETIEAELRKISPKLKVKRI